jgi:N-sulfoglucosamine sulfohydrolase
VLKGEKDSHRKFVYGMHNNIPEGPAYPIRTVTDGTWRYIRNLTPDELYIEKHLMGLQGRAALNNPYWATWIWDSHSNSRTYDLVKRYMRRPAEQLYRTANDPFEMTNLAGEKDQSAVLNRLSKELDRWMASQGDPGIPQDTQQSIGAARRGKHRFFPPDTP